MSGNGEYLFPLSFGFFNPLLETKLQVDVHQLLRSVQPVKSFSASNSIFQIKAVAFSTF